MYEDFEKLSAYEAGFIEGYEDAMEKEAGKLGDAARYVGRGAKYLGSLAARGGRAAGRGAVEGAKATGRLGKAVKTYAKDRRTLRGAFKPEMKSSKGKPFERLSVKTRKREAIRAAKGKFTPGQRKALKGMAYGGGAAAAGGAGYAGYKASQR